VNSILIVDGEAIWCGKDGKSDFDRLHSHAHDRNVLLYAFDLLELNGEDYRQHPLEKRKALEKLLGRSRGIQLSEHIDGDGELIFDHACKWDRKGLYRNGGNLHIALVDARVGLR
jgi:bifunctional non-homologous end joining protein LigD